MWLNSMDDEVVYAPRAERISFDMLVRYRLLGQRGTLLLKNLTCGGARVDGLEDLRCGDGLTLYLPSLKPKTAMVVWTVGSGAGLEFERPLHKNVFEDLIHHHARPRARTDADRALQVEGKDLSAPVDFIRHAA